MGPIFLVAGLEKVLRGPSVTAAYFSSLGIPFPELAAPVVSWLELLGGTAVLTGFATRSFGTAFALEMLVAIALARVPAALQAGSVVEAFTALRLEVLLALASAALAVSGGGSWGVDSLLHRIGRRRV